MNNSFKVFINGSPADYRTPEKIDIKEAVNFFREKFGNFTPTPSGRHFTGKIMSGGNIHFLKMALSSGMNMLLINEKDWNEQFNKCRGKKSHFLVPKNICSGYYRTYYYLITDFLKGPLLETHDNKNNAIIIKKKLGDIIDLSEYIQALHIHGIKKNDTKNSDPHQKFIEKTEIWFSDISNIVRHKNPNIEKAVIYVKANTFTLTIKPRHGDFTPWHMVDMSGGRLGLIDGEHALSEGVEYYDIAYFIQRVFSTLKERELTNRIITELVSRNYDMKKLQIVLLSRAVGGFLDESLTKHPNYKDHKDFLDLVFKLRY